MVLNLILRQEIQTYIHAAREMAKKLLLRGLLSLISKQSPTTNVLLDVGAQVLDTEQGRRCRNNSFFRKPRQEMQWTEL
jgi:hypothetical protein